MNRALVVTTINAPNGVFRSLAGGAAEHGVSFVVVGDTKTPEPFVLPGADYYDIERQQAAAPEFAALLPTKHYARKNVGYLVAAAAGADLIQETDDDNEPRPAFWDDLPDRQDVDVVSAGSPWYNVYEDFGAEGVWPRGYPLEHLARHERATTAARSVRGYVLQGLADGDPDVDAVYRLTRPLPVTFARRRPVMLAPGVWCPFNSQNTVFRSEVFALLYLPSHCSFRMTDIWRSFVAQRCLWELGEGVVFHNATAYQDRNEHDLLRDFEQEVPGYLLNDRIRRTLDACLLDGADLFRSVAVCYEALVAAALLPADETPLLRAWLAAMERTARPSI